MLEFNKIYNVECLTGMSAIHEKSIDMILCDLPYGTTENKWDCIIPFNKLWEQYKRIIKDNGIVVLHCQQPFTTELIHSNPKGFKYLLYWYKHQVSGFLNAKKQPLRTMEEIAVFYKRQPTYNPQMRKGKTQMKNTGSGSQNYHEFTAQPHLSNEYYPINLLDFPLQRFKGGHPTQKPVALCKYLIETYTNPGDLVLDNCIGSGTTAVACIETGRNFIGFEKEVAFCDMANNRILKVLSERGL